MIFNFLKVLTLLWILSVFDFTSTSEVRQMTWVKDDTYKDLTLSSSLWQTTVRSRLTCSITCTDDLQCGAFFFSDTTKLCLASSFLLSSIGQGAPLVGSEYYYFRPANCPASYMYNRKAKLCIKIFSADFTSWSVAKTNCETNAVGGGLVLIRNQDQQDFLASELAKLPPDAEFWVDGTDSTTEGTYLAKDGSTMTFFSWDTSQPDGMSNIEDCLALNYLSQYKLIDYNCIDYIHYICEVV